MSSSTADLLFLLLWVFAFAIGVMLFYWGYKSAYKRRTGKAAAQLEEALPTLRSFLNKLQQEFAIEEQRMRRGQDYLTPERVDEHRRLLDNAEKAIDEATTREKELDERAEAIVRFNVAVAQHRVARSLDKASELDEAARAAIAANARGERTYPEAAVQKMRDLTAAAKRELDVAVATNSDTKLAAQAIHRAEQPLVEAAAIANVLGLGPKAPTPEP